MLKTKQIKNYRTPMCEIVLIAQAEILCTSTTSATFGASTEDMGELDDIFANM